MLVPVFDALDETLAFSQRSAGLDLPELDRLRSTSVHAENAYPPSNNTGVSLPTLITGRRVTAVRRVGPSELLLKLEGSGSLVAWSECPDIFATARQTHLNSALAGWYHPYCRVLGRRLVRCHWGPYTPLPFQSLDDGVALQAKLLVDSVPGAFRLTVARRAGLDPSDLGLLRAWHVRQYEEIHREALGAAAAGRLGLVFVHYPIPHLPYVYDRHAQRLTTSGLRSYEDKLALGDRALGEVRRVLVDRRSQRASVGQDGGSGHGRPRLAGSRGVPSRCRGAQLPRALHAATPRSAGRQRGRRGSSRPSSRMISC